MKIDGPYVHGRRFRLKIREKGVQRYESFDTEAAALTRRTRLRREARAAATATVTEALDVYREYMTMKGNKPRSIEVTQYRLGILFRQLGGKPVGLLANAKEQIEEDLEGYRSARGVPLAVDSKWCLINQGRTFLRWCCGKGWLRANPLADARIVGRRRRGKPQLTADEGVRFLCKCLEIADAAVAGRRTVKRVRRMPQLEGSVASAACLWLGARASEIADRVVRDLDCGGTVLSIPDAKTWSGIRRLPIPLRLRPYLKRLVDKKDSKDKIFGTEANRHDIRRWVCRICRLANVPAVTPHGLRGTHSSLAREGGSTVDAVSQALGHASAGVTLGHYITPDADAAARQRRVEQAMEVR